MQFGGDVTKECSEANRDFVLDVNHVQSNVRVAKWELRKVRVVTCNFPGICSQCKQEEGAGVHQSIVLIHNVL